MRHCKITGEVNGRNITRQCLSVMIPMMAMVSTDHNVFALIDPHDRTGLDSIGFGRQNTEGVYAGYHPSQPFAVD